MFFLHSISKKLKFHIFSEIALWGKAGEVLLLEIMFARRRSLTQQGSLYQLSEAAWVRPFSTNCFASALDYF